MKKKVISGLFVVLFIGSIGFFTVSEAVGNQQNDRMNTFEMGRRYSHHRGAMNEERNETGQNEDEVEQSQEDTEVQKKWRESNDHPSTRRENSSRNHMNDSRRHNSRMNNSCW
ncbi:hypothetical protein ATZ33_00020 [Enterococcus silesiacus]|uniref:Uncharacterized protein n=1 Tax=Enterococcus silesiacus TaxID=332949 RepID=A0A0S3K6H4_9ENTE|nr:hypothetical protein [Enterococcus silesiacus]ALR99825.1 hypothetical protein ATZ33_00020 [Enterococcus silesiacus]OJG92876.1 hypothetical protein RV15_GL002821 [Enterococcus silesiacus]